MNLILSAPEEQLLLEILAERHRDLQREISHTDHHEFKLLLRKKQELLESILSRLQETQAVATTRDKS
jgi:hypothetical protein